MLQKLFLTAETVPPQQSGRVEMIWGPQNLLSKTPLLRIMILLQTDIFLSLQLLEQTVLKQISEVFLGFLIGKNSNVLAFLDSSNSFGILSMITILNQYRQ